MSKDDKSETFVGAGKKKSQTSARRKKNRWVLNNLTRKRKKLKPTWEKQRKEQILANKIEDIIRKEIESHLNGGKKTIRPERLRFEQTGENISSPNATNVLASTPEAIKLSSDFESNKRTTSAGR